MAFDLAHVEITQASGVPIAGAPPLPQAAFALEEQVCAQRDDLLYNWAQPGRRPLGSAGDPIADLDGMDDRKFYVPAAASATVTRVNPTTTKYGYWHFNRASVGGNHDVEGLRMVAPALADLRDAPGYSFLILFRPNDLADHNGLLGQGTTVGSRVGLFQNKNGQLGLQHGTNNIISGVGSPAPVGAWSAALWTYRAADKKARIYANSRIPTDEFTMTNGVTSQSNNFGLGAFADGQYSAAADIALAAGWLGYLPDTDGAVEAIMDAAMAMRAFCPQ